MKSIQKCLIFSLTSIFLIVSLCKTVYVSASIADYFSFVILSDYKVEMNIGETYAISAIAASAKKTTWKSSDSKIASVNSNGVITAKKAGTVVITAKAGRAEAGCRVTVKPTTITLNRSSVEVENHAFIQLRAKTSNGSAVKWKSSKKSVAEIDENGFLTAKKPGTTVITASADGTKVSCTVTVKKPTVTLNRTSAEMYKGDTLRLTAKISSSSKPVWKTNRKSVAVVSENGTVTAKKNGTAVISVTVDGVTRECEITVLKPEITLSCTEATLKKGDSLKIEAKVSSGKTPVWSSSNPSVARVDKKGTVTATGKGRAYIYASWDGTKVRCTIYVTEK